MIVQRNELYSLARIIFVLLIVGYHFASDDLKDRCGIFDHGQTYVTFFFVLSGFMTQLSSTRGASFSRLVYFKRKAWGLIPLYYVILLICIGIELINFRFPVVPILLQTSLLQAWFPEFAISVNPVAWFMSALFFLLFLYGMVRPYFEKMSADRFAVLSLLCWAITVLISSIFAKQSVEEYLRVIFHNPLIHLSSFLLGIALQRLAVQGKQHLLAYLFVVGLLGIIAPFYYLDAGPFRLISGGCLWAPVFCLLIYSIFLAPPVMVQCFDNRLVAWLGALSFPIYLLQFPAHKLYGKLFISGFTSDTLNFFGYLAFLVMLAALCHVFMKLLERVIRGPRHLKVRG